jgi:hypothetical protein
MSVLPLSWRFALYSVTLYFVTRLGLALIPGKLGRLPLNLLVKKADNANEAAALRQLDVYRGLHAPILLDAASRGGSFYILTNFVPGDRVSRVWESMTAADKANLVLDLRDQFDALAHQSSRQCVAISNAEGGVINDPRISWLAEFRPRVIHSTRDFFIEAWRWSLPLQNRDRLRPHIEPLINGSGDGLDDVKFCHGDLHPANLIFPGGLENWRNGQSRVCIVDWEFAGWMPAPWEALKASFLLVDDDEEWLALIRDVFPAATQHLDADWQWRLLSNVGFV